METYLADGTDPQPYASGNIPTTRPMRKIGVKLNTPVWVKRSALNAQGQRASTSGALEAWTSFPLSHATDGPACGFERILSKASWSDLSTDHKAIDSDTTPWWYVTVAKAAGQEISGWVPEVDPIITKHSPWEWPGFSLIEDTTPIVSQLAGTLSAEGTLSTEETHAYAAKIDEAERGPMFQRLFKIIDQPNDAGVRDKELTAFEIKSALGKPWLSQQLSLLITNYESEWFWKDTKWNELDPLMAHSPGEPNPDWEKEKQRIDKLSWWATLVGKHGINADGKVWHFQTAGLVANCINKCSCLNIEKFVEEYKKEHQQIFGWFEAGSHVSLPHPLNQESEENLRNLLKMIMKLWNEYFDECNDVYLAYMLSTIRVESYDWDKVVFFGPICEKISYAQAEIDYGSGPTGRRVAMAIANHNTEIGDGFKYRGRGLVQITWKINYEKFSTALGIDFPGDPELALNLENTTRIMLGGMRDGIFSHGNTLAVHLSPSNKNYFTARKIINGSDRANVFKFYAEKFENLLLRIKN